MLAVSWFSVNLQLPYILNILFKLHISPVHKVQSNNLRLYKKCTVIAAKMLHIAPLKGCFEACKVTLQSIKTSLCIFLFRAIFLFQLQSAKVSRIQNILGVFLSTVQMQHLFTKHSLQHVNVSVEQKGFYMQIANIRDSYIFD